MIPHSNIIANELQANELEASIKAKELKNDSHSFVSKPASKKEAHILRIVGGKYKNRWLYVPKNPRIQKNLRPSSEILRKALFDILLSKNHSLEKSSFLDLFAGTGAIGIEALSHESHVSFVEKDPLLISSIHKNLKSLTRSKEILKEILPVEIFSMDVFHFLKKFPKIKKIYKKSANPKEFDYIFLDPPYPKVQKGRQEYYETLLNMIFTSGLIKKTSLIILEHPEPIHFKNLAVPWIHKRRYGQTALSFFQS